MVYFLDLEVQSREVILIARGSAKAVHHQLHATYSLQNVFLTNIALRAPVENAFRRSLYHDDVSVPRNRNHRRRDGAQCNLMRFIESVFRMRVSKYEKGGISGEI